MQGAFDALPCGYVAFSDDGIIKDCNATLLSWLGYGDERLTGSRIETILTIASRIFYNTHFFPLLRLHATANEIYLSLKDKNGNSIPVLTNAKRDSTVPEPVSYCVFIRVEERKKFEQELLDAKRQAEDALNENRHLAELTKSLERHSIELEKHYQHQITTNESILQFSKVISHDLQEPIHKIQIFIDSICNDPDTTLSSRSRIMASKVDSAARRLRALTQSLDEYISADNEKNRSKVDLNAVILKATTRASTFRNFFEFDIAAEALPLIDGYEKQLELMFFHLIDNAIQFRSPSRRLAIRINQLILEENLFRVSKDQYKYAEHLQISVEDNGIGFSEEYKEYVFQLLKKIDSNTAGVGLGLPIVRKIVQNHSGQIRLSSRPGHGTRLEIIVPVQIDNP